MALSSSHAASVPFYARAVIALPTALFAWFCTLLPAVSAGTPLYWKLDWLPQHGITFGFLVDGLSLLFALLITGIGALIFLYASEYMRGYPQFGRFTSFLVAFMLSMLGVVLSENLITLFIFWELTGITSFLLIGYSHEDPTARRSALQALLVTGAGALAMLAGFVLLGEASGTYSLRELLSHPGALTDHPHYSWILFLILAGAFTKSAQFPFHFWLPNAMAAPTPVSAYLHSATMVKAGVFLLARMAPILGGTEAWTLTLVGFGAVTTVYASVLALTRTDLKQVLAYTTVMALGACVLFLGLPAVTADGEVSAAAIAAIALILVHALYKAALFMVAGAIEHSTGTRDLRRLGGLRRAMGPTFVAAILAAISMAGLPPAIGFVGKEMLYTSALGSTLGWFAFAAIFSASAMVVTASMLVAVAPFFGGRSDAAEVSHSPSWQLWSGPYALGVVGIAAGLVASQTAELLILPAASVVAPLPEQFEVGLWHGFSPLLLLSLATWGFGAAVYWQRSVVLRAISAGVDRLPVTGDQAYDGAMNGIARLAYELTRQLQSGIQRRYILTVFSTLALAVGVTLVVKNAAQLPSTLPSAPFIEWMLAALIAASALTTILARTRLLAICALGTAGTAASLIFLLLGAPDVAMAQLMIETLVVVIVAIILLKLPDFSQEIRSSRAKRWRDAAVSLAVGSVTTIVLLSVTAKAPQRGLTDYFERMAVPGGHGRNIVNVILVEFRALDTLGEISVLVMAGAAICALSRRRSRYRADEVEAEADSKAGLGRAGSA